MKIYTRTGDDGSTGLFGGDRVPKHDPRVDSYGTVDETNAILGLTLSHLRDQPGSDILVPILQALQSELFTLGADLATPMASRPVITRISEDSIARLEQTIDRLQADLPPLRQFILPGGTTASSALHLARTVCRRAERLAVLAADRYEINRHVLVYLNRLSDLLFVLARWTNWAAGISEPVWISGEK